MSDRPFLDTSVLFYLAVDDWRTEKAEALLRSGFSISVQVLNEFTLAVRRKAGLDWDQTQLGLTAIKKFSGTPLPVTLQTHESGLQIARRYGFRIYDSLLLASALEAGSTIFYSEDMQHGQQIGSLTIRNPFVTQ